MSARILAGSVFDVLPTITPGSVDCAVTSIPYWKLRSYLPKDHPLKPQELGSEDTIEEFIVNQVRVSRLVRDCLADHGTYWLNCGDTYAGGSSGESGLAEWGAVHARGGGHSDKEAKNGRPAAKGIPGGNLCLIPQRLAIALQDDGWIIRSVIVWQKPAPMPASVSGWMWKRCRVKVKASKHGGGNGNQRMLEQGSKGHGITEDWLATWSDCPGCEKCEKNAGLVLRRGSWRPTSSWEPILMLAKSSSYYADGEAVKTPGAVDSGWARQRARGVDTWEYTNGSGGNTTNGIGGTMPATGANPRDVQTWASEPLKEKHYAAYPTALVRFCLRAGTSLRGYCPTCGAPWARVVETPTIPGEMRNRDAKMGYHPLAVGGGQKIQDWREENPSQTLGWRPTCRCPEQEPRPALVLDPFAGSGRTLLTAQRMGLDAVGVELNPEYIVMARKILRDDSPLFAGGVE